jgi:hypothetical protein
MNKMLNGRCGGALTKPERNPKRLIAQVGRSIDDLLSTAPIGPDQVWLA